MKYHIITYGCQMNKSDSEKIAAILEKKGYEPIKTDSSAEALAKADLIVVNMCSVRQSAVDRILGLSQKFSKLKTKNSKLKTVLTGCFLKEDKRKFIKFFDEIWDNKNYSNLSPKYQYYPQAFIPISNGCNNFCAYCVVPFTRGRLVCRDHKEILAEVKNVVKKRLNPIRNATSNGAREIWLLGQNVNDYISEQKIESKKQKINFAKLIKMVDEIPGDFKFFFVSPHPKNFSDELIGTLARCEKFGKYFNLPVQSGDDEILKKMKRPYTIKQYKNLVEKIQEKIPDIKLSTDIIVGFPGETKKQFENTVKLFKEIKFNTAYIAKYSPRPGTAAFQMKDNVPLSEKKSREKILREILKR